jgi:integrase/recombinase XerC
MTRLGLTARIGHRVHPHGLRHTFAAELYGEGAGMRHIQIALGHKTLATTEAYLVSIGCNEVNDMLAKREW